MRREGRSYVDGASEDVGDDLLDDEFDSHGRDFRKDFDLLEEPVGRIELSAKSETLRN